MPAKDTLRVNKTHIQGCLCGDYKLILGKVQEKGLITHREYNNLKSINKEDVEGHVVELVDKIMNKGEKSCQDFLNLLQTDEDIKTTYPELQSIQLNNTQLLPKPIQASTDNNDVPPESKRQKLKEQYQLKSQPVGLCLIINNENFMSRSPRTGTNKDAESLAEVFSWLGFRVLMCKDQTQDQMDQTLKCFASLSDPSQLQEFNVKEWFGIEFIDLQQQAPKHGDAFVCCILSHGQQRVVLGTDSKPLPIKHVTRTFKATDQSALTNKPKLFFIQACQGKGKTQHGVLCEDLETDDSPSSIPEEADVLVAIATVEDYVSNWHKTEGTWFIQSLCQQLKERCPKQEDITTILHCVNNDVSQKEGISSKPGEEKQMPEIRSTLRGKLVLGSALTL